MARKSFRRTVLVMATLAHCPGSRAEETLRFNTHIRPILSEYCFLCHGPDAGSRKAGLRLDTREGALAALAGEPGRFAVVPGNPDTSAAVARILTDDPDDIMPPPSLKKSLSEEQKRLLVRWVREGAAYEKHWAYVPPARPAVPAAQAGKTPVDAFLDQRIAAEKAAVSPPAGKRAELRRLTYALTGLPPTPEELADYEADTASNAYERRVDRLLASPRYGEHMARYWLDAARYADTHGFHLDNYRENWAYRDWVVNAFNENKPFDRFTVEQLAGDLLEKPALEQRIATGFIRSHPTTGEGGSIDAEVLVRYGVDRVETFSTLWLGSTLTCASCHDHKYDPFSAKDFYSLFAFFNSTAEAAMDKNAKDPPPVVRVPTPAQAAMTRELDERIEALEGELYGPHPGLDVRQAAWEREAAATDQAAVPEEVTLVDDTPPRPGKLEGKWNFVKAPHPVRAGTSARLQEGAGTIQHFAQDLGEPLRIEEGARFFAWVWLDDNAPPSAVMLQFHSAGQWEHRAYWGSSTIPYGQPGGDGPQYRRLGDLPPAGRWVRLEVAAEQVGLKPGDTVSGYAFTQQDGKAYWDDFGVTRPDARALARQLAGVPEAKRTPEQRRRLLVAFRREVMPEFGAREDELGAARQEIEKVRQAYATTLVAAELPSPRKAHRLVRGEYDKPAEEVSRETPAVLPPMAPDLPRNRLGLARWLLDPGHPLTARVAVNRLWQQVYGVGLVKTSEDFGSQGETPSHPELLDWLAVEFREGGWDVKAMARRLVTTEAFRRSARAAPGMRERDPENRLLARGPRSRLDAEVIRDGALAASGLLVERLGGPPVKPYQPDGVWEAVAYADANQTSNTRTYLRDSGEGLYRRSLYSFWKRTAPPPALAVLDAPDREVCVVRRERTNTPLAALALLNDVQFVEAARVLAREAIRRDADPGARLDWMFERCASRRPAPAEREALLAYAAEERERFACPPAGEARQLLAVGETPPDPALDAAEHAAWTLVANVLLNLDETLSN